MKKIIAVAASLVIAAAAFAKDGKVVIGATPVPHAEMLNLIKDDLAKQGVNLIVKEFTDYVILNDALESGELDANFDQHIPYMESTNKEKGYHLVNAGGIHIEPIALYSKKHTKLDQIGKKATIAIPNDPTNGGRALLLLQSAGLITLRDGAGITATVLDVTKNPLKLKFKEIDAASLPRVLSDVDAAVINGNYAIPAGLSATKDGLFVEGKDSPYVNIIAVKAGNEKDADITALVKALQSDKIRQYVNSTFKNGEVVIAF